VEPRGSHVSGAGARTPQLHSMPLLPLRLQLQLQGFGYVLVPRPVVDWTCCNRLLCLCVCLLHRQALQHPYFSNDPVPTPPQNLPQPRRVMAEVRAAIAATQKQAKAGSLAQPNASSGSAGVATAASAGAGSGVGAGAGAVLS